MFELKRITMGGVEAALKKAHRYRLLNEPWQAESICRDILEVDPDNQEALVSLILALTDQFGSDRAPSVEEPRALLPRLESEYKQTYYGGIICERRGTAYLKRRTTGSGPMIYDWLRQAMALFEEAEAIRPEGIEEAILRWNTCARVIMKHDEVREASAEGFQPLLE